MTDGTTKVVVTGIGAICAAGREPDEIWEAVRAGRSAVAPLRRWDDSYVPSWNLAATHRGADHRKDAGRRPPPVGELANFDPRALVADRKLHKLLRRTDLLGLYVAGKAIDGAGLGAQRERLDPRAAVDFNDRSGVFVGSGGGAYQNQYDFFPLLTAAHGDLRTFGSELSATINPLWLLRTLPNNVLCHIGIRYGFKGPNACVTQHSVSGTLAVAEAAAALRAGEADRAVAVGHDAPIEPQTIHYYQRLGLLTADAVRPFDAGHSGIALGEGAAALVLEDAAVAAARRATVLGELLGSGCTAETEGLLAIRADGDGVARAIGLALDAAGLRAADIGMIVAHGNGARQSDASEAAAILRVFGGTPPPVTAFKWAIGHLFAASGAVETVMALTALRHGVVPGIATLRELDPDLTGLQVSAAPQTPRSNVALVISRGFAGATVVLVVRA